LRDDYGKPLFTLQQLSLLVSSQNRQAASQHIEDFRDCGLDFKGLVTRQRKVDEIVVSAVKVELMADPLASIFELRERTNLSLLRNDISSENVKAALESISVKQVRGEIQKRLSRGEAHYKEEYLLLEMMNSLKHESGEKAGISSPSCDGNQFSSETAIRSLLTPNTPISSIGNPIKWVIFIMTLYYHGIPLSVLGRWFSVHKTTILRWIISLAVSLWPIVYIFINKKVKGKVVYIDLKWLKIKGTTPCPLY
jgi:hypothetical protein